MNTNDLDIICFSPVRWDAGEQRPQQLLRRAARSQRVFFIEEPILITGESSQLFIQQDSGSNVWRVIPHLSEGLSPSEKNFTIVLLIQELLQIQEIHRYLIWFFTSQVLDLTRRLTPELVIYDCLSQSDKGNPKATRPELELLHSADLVITDGQRMSRKRSLFSSAPDYYPGSLDLDHYFESRSVKFEPVDQAEIPHPRLGFFGVINRLFDIRLVQEIAALRPDWHLVLTGPINIDPGHLIDMNNVHYLSTRSYDLMPAYLAGWDAGILPIVQRKEYPSLSCFQAPIYLAAGCPVISTPIPELIQFFGRREIAWFARTAEQFVQAAEEAIERKKSQSEWLTRVDECLIDCTWDIAWAAIERSIEQYQPVKVAAPPRDTSRVRSPERAEVFIS